MRGISYALLGSVMHWDQWNVHRFCTVAGTRVIGLYSDVILDHSSKDIFHWFAIKIDLHKDRV
jgi:hypothetical protein